MSPTSDVLGPGVPEVPGIAPSVTFGWVPGLIGNEPGVVVEGIPGLVGDAPGIVVGGVIGFPESASAIPGMTVGLPPGPIGVGLGDVGPVVSDSSDSVAMLLLLSSVASGCAAVGLVLIVVTLLGRRSRTRS